MLFLRKKQVFIRQALWLQFATFETRPGTNSGLWWVLKTNTTAYKTPELLDTQYGYSVFCPDCFQALSLKQQVFFIFLKVHWQWIF